MKAIIKRLRKACVVCGKTIKVILYSDKKYSGGHYFGKIPLYKKRELNKSLKAGTRKTKIGKLVFNVLKRDFEPYAHTEYWECQKCYNSK